MTLCARLLKGVKYGCCCPLDLQETQQSEQREIMATESGGLVKRTPQQVQAANLLILQRSDDAVSEILATATHVVIYVFAPATKQWERKEIEGSLFVVKRNYGVRFRLVVLNRVKRGDLEEDLDSSFTFEDMSPYLLYRRHTDSDKDAETLAIWFHSEKDRVHIAGCLRKVLRLHSSVDPKQQDQRQAQERESLLGSALPPAPTLTDLSRVDNTEAMKSRTTSTSAETTKEKKPTAIEDLLLKAASLGGGSAITRPELDRKADTLTTSPARRAAAASPPAITNMLLRPKVATAHAAPAAETGRPTCTNGSGRGPGQGSIVSTLLNPLGMVRPISNSTCSDSGNGGTISPARSLDKQQLKEALLALLEEDAFLETLHRAYLRRRTE